MSEHRVHLAVVLLLLPAIMAGCQRPTQPTTPTANVVSKPASGPKEEYYLLAVSTNSAYWLDSREGVEAWGAQTGVAAHFQGPNSADPAEQARQLDALIAKKPAGIAVVPGNPDALKPGIDRAVEAGIPIVTVDTDSPESKRYCYIGTNNYEAGLIVGKLLGEAMGGEGSYGISMLVNQWNIEERKRGVMDALRNYPRIRYVQTVNDKAQLDVSTTVNAQMIAAHPEITGIAGLDGESGAGIARAVIEAGKKGTIKIVAFDRNEEMLDYIEDGTMTASVAQKTHLMSWLALTLLYSLNHDEVHHLPDWRAADSPPLPANVDTGTMVITKENVAQFRHDKR